MNRGSRKLLPLLLLCSLCAAPATEAAAEACALPDRDSASIGSAIAPAWAEALLDALADTDDRGARLATALRRVPADRDTDPLVARARVTLGALALAAGDIEPARAHLRQVPLDTDAALDAGLLMAESMALEGDLERALQWNLRVLRRWPDEPAAVNAAIQRAAALGARDPAKALGALDEARSRAVAAAGRLEALDARLTQENWFSAWLASGGEPELDAELTPVFFRTVASTPFQAARGVALATGQPALCVRARAAQLARLQQDLDRVLQESTDALSVLSARLAVTRPALEQQRAAFLASDGRDAALGRQVNALRNRVARDEAEALALQSALEGLPGARQRLAARAAALEATTGATNARASREVIDALRATVTSRRNAMRDLAGTASLRIGELRDPRYGERHGRDGWPR